MVVTCYIGRRRALWTDREKKPVWWPAIFEWKNINNGRNKPRLEELVAIMASFNAHFATSDVLHDEGSDDNDSGNHVDDANHVPENEGLGDHSKEEDTSNVFQNGGSDENDSTNHADDANHATENEGLDDHLEEEDTTAESDTVTAGDENFMKQLRINASVRINIYYCALLFHVKQAENIIFYSVPLSNI